MQISPRPAASCAVFRVWELRVVSARAEIVRQAGLQGGTVFIDYRQGSRYIERPPSSKTVNFHWRGVQVAGTDRYCRQVLEAVMVVA